MPSKPGHWWLVICQEEQQVLALQGLGQDSQPGEHSASWIPGQGLGKGRDGGQSPATHLTRLAFLP